MKVFKFGGGSVKDASGVKNIAQILRHEGTENTLVVVSAMGKMTNAFERIVSSYCNHLESLKTDIDFVKSYHFNIIKELFGEKKQGIGVEMAMLFQQLMDFLSSNTEDDRNFIYDQIVGYGEMLSTKIISAYLQEESLKNSWIDVRNYITTNSNYREAQVDWDISKKNIASLDPEKLYITQGFLGANNQGATTTLGREGSDFSAAIFAHCLKAEKLIIWKDVPGLLNADPRYFKNPQMLEQISYKMALEMANYGASVIHPKTMNPLESNEIPLFIRPFHDFESKGTSIGKDFPMIPEVPCTIVKKSQWLLLLNNLDPSVFSQEELDELYQIIGVYRLKINLIQNGANSMTLCMHDPFDNFKRLLAEMKTRYVDLEAKKVDLYTLLKPNAEALSRIEEKGTVILKQIRKETVQLIILQ
jgi:aspartate kinase